MSKNKFSRAIEYGTNKVKTKFNVTLQRTREAVGFRTPSSFDPDFNRTFAEYKAFEKTIGHLLEYIVIYLQPKSKERHHLMIESMSYTNLLRKERVIQMEEQLGQIIINDAHELGADPDNIFRPALLKTGETFVNIAKLRTERDFLIKSRVLAPIKKTFNEETKEINLMRKKLDGKRLRFDATNGKSSDHNKRVAKQKLDIFIERVAEKMKEFIDKNRKRIIELFKLVQIIKEYQLEYGRLLGPLCLELEEALRHADLPIPESVALNATIHTIEDTLNIHQDSLHIDGNSSIRSRFTPADSIPSKKPIPPLSDSVRVLRHEVKHNFHESFASTVNSEAPEPYCIVQFDFEKENYGEMDIFKGEKIILLNQLDDEWLEGKKANGQIGYFPIEFVKVIVPLQSA